jgi:multiple sugar transport system substrate-binding protein
MLRRNLLTAALALTATGGLTGGAHAAGPVTITLWHMEQPPHRVQRVQELLDAFNKANPDIVARQEPQSWGDVYAKAPAAIAAGNAPDILFAIPDFTTVIKQLGALTPVQDLVAELDAKHKFIPAAVKPYSYDGGVWAVPLYNMALSLWYRKSALAAAGVAAPQTWSQWQAAAKALTKGGVYGMGLPANKQLYTDQTVYAVMTNAGASELFNADGSVRFDNPDSVKAFRFYKDLYQYTAPDAASWTWGEAEACFDSESCAMVLQFTVIKSYDQQGGKPDDLGVIAVPHADSQAASNTIAYSNAAMILAKDPAKQAAARKLITFLLEPENYGRFLNMEPGLFLPVTQDGAKSASFWDDPLTMKYRPQVETMIANSQSGMLFGFTGEKVFPSIGAISAQNILAETLQKVVVDGKSPEAAVTAGQARMQDAARK